MRDTLRHYRVCDSPSFRLVQNAIDELMTMAPKTNAVATPSPIAIVSVRGNGDIIALCRREVAALPDFGAGDEGDLLRDLAARADERIAGTHQYARIRIDWPRPVLEFSGKAIVHALEARLFRFAQIEIGEQPPQRDTGAANQGLLDPAQPPHELGQEPAWNAVGEQEVDVLLLHDPGDQGSCSHLNVIRLK